MKTTTQQIENPPVYDAGEPHASPCPFCQKSPMTRDTSFGKYVHCKTPKCPTSYRETLLEDWERRISPAPPVEADKDAEKGEPYANDPEKRALYWKTKHLLVKAELTTARATIAEQAKRIETLVGALEEAKVRITRGPEGPWQFRALVAIEDKLK